LFSQARPNSLRSPVGPRPHARPTCTTPLPCSRGRRPTGHCLCWRCTLPTARPPTTPSSSAWRDQARALLHPPLHTAPPSPPLSISSQMPPEPWFFFPLWFKLLTAAPWPSTASTCPRSCIGAHRHGEPWPSTTSTRPRHMKLLQQGAAERHRLLPRHGERPLRAPLSSDRGSLIVPLPPCSC
jgi:hypothetical protein